MEVEYQGDDIAVVSKKPLRGKLALVGEDAEEVTLLLDRESAGELFDALLLFMNED